MSHQKVLGVQSYFLFPLPNKFVTFILKEGLREHELGVLGIENPLESCSIGEDDIIIDTPENNEMNKNIFIYIYSKTLKMADFLFGQNPTICKNHHF